MAKELILLTDVDGLGIVGDVVKVVRVCVCVFQTT